MHAMRFLAPLVAIGLLGCNGGDDTDTDGGDTIVDVAAANPEFSLLVQAVTRAGLVDTLSGDGPFTVFAPTNAAFEALLASNDEWNTIDDIDVAVLTDVLLYHVVAGEVASSAIPARADSASDITLFFDASAPSVNGASITQTDIDASNGVIHVIDEVLLPPDVATAAQLAGLTTLVAAVEHGQAGPTLAAGEAWTVFAPTNDAFDALLGSIGATQITQLPAGLVNAVVSYHLVDGAVASGDVQAGIAPSALANPWQKPVSLFLGTEGGVTVNGNAVIIADVKTTNGIVHVIDGVLIPPTVPEAAGIAGLTGLTDTIGKSSDPQGLINALNGEGPFTVFAPTNEAFAAAQSVVDSLPASTVTTVLQTHVVAADVPVTSADLVSGSVTALSGQSLTIDASAPSVSWGNTANIVVTDIHTLNGVVHLIDAVLVPPS